MFPQHTIDTAPAGSKDTLMAIQKGYGFLPNLALILAGSPSVLNGYIGLMSAFTGGDTSLTPVEQQIVLLAASVENGCDYCSAAHGMVANKTGLGRDEVLAVQNGQPLGEARLEALRVFTVKTVQKRGWLDTADVAAFTDAGFNDVAIMEVITGVAIKVITNYVNHLAKPDLNAEFADFAVPQKAAE